MRQFYFVIISGALDQVFSEHCVLKIIAIVPDRKTDGIASSIIEGMHDLGIEVIASSPGNGVRKVYSDHEIIKNSRTADFIFAFWGKVRGNSPPKHYLLNHINRPDITAYVDGSEWNRYGQRSDRQEEMIKSDFSLYRGEPWINEEMLTFCKWYFKRECYTEDLDRGIIPLPFSSRGEYLIKDTKKDIDVFCCFGQNLTGFRSQIEEYCRKIEGRRVIIESKVSRARYNDLLSRSLIVISSWGGGQCCFREWEAMGAKACCLVQRHTIEFPDKPIDNNHWVEYSNMHEFNKKMKMCLNNSDFCVRIGQNGFEFSKNKHMPKNRVEYMIEKMNERRI